MKQIAVTVTNKLGLHARPSALLVRAATKFRSDFFIEKDEIGRASCRERV